MKKIYKIGFVVILLGIIGAIAVYLYVNKPHPDYAGLEPDYTLRAESLYYEFKENPESAAAKYNGKMIKITGKPYSTEKADTMLIIVYAFEEGLFGAEGIRCSVLPEFKKKINENNFSDDFSIKGFCVGYNDTDVILEKCSIN